MDSLPYGRYGGTSLLFDEDFDLPPRSAAPEPPPEPEVIEPVFTVAELEAARAEAWREGHDQARDEAAAASETVARQALAVIAAHIGDTKAEAEAIADHAAEAIAHLLLSAFTAAFPALCRHHGEAEIRAVVQRIVPALQSEPKVTIRVAADAEAAVAQELARLDPDIAAQAQIVAADLPPGDVRIAWRAGHATRDTARLWQEIEAILAPAGLLPTKTTLKETADAD